MPSVRVNGIDVYYEISGQGYPLLIVPGLGMDLTQLGGIVTDLSARHMVIAFDNRGVGRTDKPDIPYSIDMMGEDTAGLLDAIGIAKADVLGISLGGKIALSLAIHHHEKVRSLILASTSARANYRRGVFWALSNMLIRIPYVRAVGTRFPQPYFAYVRQRDASLSYDATDRLQGVMTPTLILHGKSDRVAPYYLAEEIHDGIRGSVLIGLDGGHLFFYAREKEFAASIEGFLRTRSAEPSKTTPQP
jgi:pimeloyl-ACP methyl ester carboxylesterase